MDIKYSDETRCCLLDDKKRREVEKRLVNTVKGFMEKYNIKSLNAIEIYKFDEKKQELGAIKKEFVNKLPSTVLFISDLSLQQISQPHNVKYGIHTVHHELCHVKDFETICNNMNGILVTDSYEHPYSMESLCFIWGYELFGEYLAYRNSYSSYAEQKQQHNFILYHEMFDDIIQDITLICNSKQRRQNTYTNENLLNITKRIVMFICKNLGYYHASNNKVFMKNMAQIADVKFIEYINQLDEQLKKWFQGYPNWISYNSYVEIGCLVLSVFSIYGVDLAVTNNETCFHMEKEVEP